LKRIVHPIVTFLHAVLLSAGAILALVVLPPVGMLMLLMLRRHLDRETRQLRARA
jgi:p-aminobenzoyl-glutamate transporter AbgT